MPDLRGLDEALQRTGIAEFMAQEEALPADVQTVRAAARLVASLLEPCPTCEGTRYEPIPDEPEFDVDVECEDCSGSGLQVSRQAIERGAEIVYTQKWGRPMSVPRPDSRDAATAEAVLRALLLGDTE